MLLENALAFRSADELRERHARSFAEWLREGSAFPAERLARASSAVREDLAAAWGAAAAEEWLLAKNCGSAPEMVPGFLQSSRTFSAGLPLFALASLQAACGVIPLHQEPRGAMARIWVVADPDATLSAFANAPLDGVKSLFPGGGGYRVFVAGYDAEITGSSWQLGAVLARHALEKRDLQTIRRLATEWMVTGEVSPNDQPGESPRLKEVKIETKAKLAEEKRDGGRIWLLPTSNMGVETLNFRRATRGRLRHALDRDTAWRHVTGQGVLEDIQPQQWPAGVQSMHCLVSDALGPMIAAFHHTQPQEIKLWVSDKMKDRADALTQVLDAMHAKGLLPANLTKHPRSQINSGSIAEAEALLLKDASLASAEGVVLFNVTGGNLLMRFAVNSIAQLNPDIAMIYRDVDADDNTFTKLHYPGLQGATTKLRPPANSPDGGWKTLLERMAPPRPYSAEDAAKMLVEKIKLAIDLPA